MFAFALWDERAEALYLVRDRMGKKPLYFTTNQGVLCFASELQALLCVHNMSREIDELALDQYLSLGYIPAPRTIYRDVKKMEAGCYLEVRKGELKQVRYWTPDEKTPSVKGNAMDWEDAKEELLRRLRRATALRMVSDVPVGCFLSGGVDSSAVLSFMAEISGSPVKTFSVGFSDSRYNELPYARAVAQHFGTDHCEYVLEPDGISILDELVSHFGEPFADSSALPMWYLSKATRQSVTVALTGDGGDELFGGYGWYSTSRRLESASFVPQWLARVAASFPVVKKSGPLRAAVKAAALLMVSSGERHARLRQLMSPHARKMLYTQDFQERTDGQALRWLVERHDAIALEDPLNRMMATDLVTYLAEDLLVKVDRTSMAHSLECRSPLLDSDLVEWTLRLPSSYKLSPKGTKLLLREAVSDRFPPGFLDRPKQGFSVPLASWFRGDLQTYVVERVLNGSLMSLGVFDQAGLRRLIADHFAGNSNHEATVWALLVLGSWMEHGLARSV